MVAYVIERLDTVTLAPGSPVEGMDLMSPYVWRENGDYRMLFPADGIGGIKRFFVDTLVQFGKRGLACQPAIVGVGIGGAKDTCVRLGKEAACLRAVGSRNPDPAIAALEDELTALGNYIGIGAMGFAGTSLVVATHVEVAYSHTGGMPVGIHSFCLSSRRATARS